MGGEFFIFAFGVFRTLDEMFSFEGRVFLAAIPGVILAAETAVGDDTTSGKTVLGVGALMGIALTLIILSLRRIRDHGRAPREGGHFRDVAEYVGDWVWEMDTELKFTYLSARFFEQFPIIPEIILGKTRAEYIGAGTDDPGWRNHFKDIKAQRPFRDFKYSFTDENGRLRHIRISGRPVFDAQGAYKGYQGTGADLTAEVEATAQAARAEAILADAPEPHQAAPQGSPYLPLNSLQIQPKPAPI